MVLVLAVSVVDAGIPSAVLWFVGNVFAYGVLEGTDDMI